MKKLLVFSICALMLLSFVVVADESKFSVSNLKAYYHGGKLSVSGLIKYKNLPYRDSPVVVDVFCRHKGVEGKIGSFSDNNRFIESFKTIECVKKDSVWFVVDGVKSKEVLVKSRPSSPVVIPVEEPKCIEAPVFPELERCSHHDKKCDDRNDKKVRDYWSDFFKWLKLDNRCK